MKLFVEALDREMDELHANGVRIRFIGDRDALASELRARMRAGEERTADNQGLTLVIAVGYGGRWDIARAARSLARDAVGGGLDPSTIDEQAVAERLATAGLPDPDLLIRTGGNQRISNFLLWQLAYSECFFTDRLWPDFGEEDLEAALAQFAGTERRFGQTSEQLAGRQEGAC